MRAIVFSIFLVTVLTLTFQSIASAGKIKDTVGHESSRNELAATVKPTAIARMNGRKDGMMMNMSAAVGHNDKGKDDALDTMNKIFTMCKTLVTTALAFVDPIFKAKNFGLSVIATMITVLKFLMDLKNSKNNEKKKEAWEVGNTVIDDRIGMPYASYPISQAAPAYRPTYLAQYPSYMPKYRPMMPMAS